MKKKMESSSGLALIFWILILGILIFLVLIFVPKFTGSSEAVRRKMDEGHEETARDSALMKYMAEGSFSAVYDMKNKKFVPLIEIDRVPTYGESDANQNKVICVQADGNGKITLRWVRPGDKAILKEFMKTDPAEQRVVIPY